MLSIHRLREELRAAGGRWNAGETPVSVLPAIEQRLLLGYLPTDQQRLVRRNAQARVLRSRRVDRRAYHQYDLRAREGYSFVGPVRGPRRNASCTDTVATVAEGNLRIMIDDPGIDLITPTTDAPAPAAERPWLVEPLANMGFEVRGGVHDGKFVHIYRWHELVSAESMKNWLTEHGPLLAELAVHEDFYSYVNGVYHHVTGRFDGAHCVAIIGFDESGGYWIAQNAWGRTWGEDGCFRIAFGERGIDASMWGVELRFDKGGGYG